MRTLAGLVVAPLVACLVATLIWLVVPVGIPDAHALPRTPSMAATVISWVALLAWSAYRPSLLMVVDTLRMVTASLNLVQVHRLGSAGEVRLR